MDVERSLKAQQSVAESYLAPIQRLNGEWWEEYDKLGKKSLGKLRGNRNQSLTGDQQME